MSNDIKEERLAKLLHRVQNKDAHITCCLPCHFSYEEKEAFQYLPEEIRASLLEEHRKLKEEKYPIEKVFAHSVAEMPLFEKYCPQNVLDRIDADHLDYYIKKGIVKVNEKD